MNIHYHRVTGQIMMVDVHSVPRLKSHWSDHFVTFVAAEDGCAITIDAKSQKIDVLTGELIDKAHDEQAHALLPDALAVAHAIAYELQHTDGYAVPDRPMNDAKRASWKTYRQTLRDLSKLSTPVERVAAWPLRPDGSDAIPALRERVDLP